MKTKYYSYLIGSLSKGCRLCVQGKKLVFLITGLCGRKCYYCPLSEQKKFKDVVYADEWPIKEDKEILEEIRLCNSRGAGITGGDPLIVFNRTLRYIKLFKRKFGKRFHIHLYAPTELITREKLSRLHKAGLDEIRIHPNFLANKKDWNKIRLAKEFDWDITVEIPVIPGKEKEIKDLILFLDEIKINFLNLNELEMSETNADYLLKRGFHCKDKISYGVKGSEELALRLLKWVKKNNVRLNVHYCTSRLKNSVQLVNRMKRRAKNVAKKYDLITKEGTLFRGVIYLKRLKPGFDYNKVLEKVKNKKGIIHRLDRIEDNLKRQFNIPDSLIEVDKIKLRILTSAYIADKIKVKLKEEGLIPALIEEFPTHDQLEVMINFL